MGGYLGEEIVNQCDTEEFKDFTASDWALYYIEQYASVDGESHKLWVMDQVARILNGVKPVISLAKWSNGDQEYRVNLGEPTKKYLEWVESLEEDSGFGYDEGRAP